MCKTHELLANRRNTFEKSLQGDWLPVLIQSCNANRNDVSTLFPADHRNRAASDIHCGPVIRSRALNTWCRKESPKVEITREQQPKG